MWNNDVCDPECNNPQCQHNDCTAKQIIDRAFVQIRDLFVSRHDKTILYYSAEDDSDKIGLRIFAGMVGDDVVDYITQKLKEIPEEVRKARFL